MKHNQLSTCPICGGDIIEDVWEDLIETENGNIVMNMDPAYICNNHCGYAKKIQELPNLFEFATSELSQDAFLCWLFDHVRLDYEGVATQIGESLLKKITNQYIKHYPDILPEQINGYYVVKVEQQVDHIDVLLTLTSDTCDEKIYIVIEDKIHSGESRKNQPEYYASKLKKTNPNAIIIPVMLKTGYATEAELKKYDTRKIVFIGYQDIYNLFIPYLNQLKENIILQNWWEHFYEMHYSPIEVAQSMDVNETFTLKQFNDLCTLKNIPDVLTFQIITDYLFKDIGDVRWKRSMVQGKGHADWHFQIQNKLWKRNKNKTGVRLDFIWNRRDFSFVIKTAPVPYRPKRRLSEAEQKRYNTIQKSIKLEVKNLKLENWKMSNYYLTVGHMKDVQEMSLIKLKQTIEEDIKLLSDRFDEIMMNELN